MPYVHPNAEEFYYLRMLLNVMRNPKNFDEIKEVNSIVYHTYQSTCFAGDVR